MCAWQAGRVAWWGCECGCGCVGGVGGGGGELHEFEATPAEAEMGGERTLLQGIDVAPHSDGTPFTWHPTVEAPHSRGTPQ